MNISAGCETGAEAGVSFLEELTKVTGDWKINNISQSHNVFFAEMYRLNLISQKATMVQQV